MVQYSNRLLSLVPFCLVLFLRLLNPAVMVLLSIDLIFSVSFSTLNPNILGTRVVIPPINVRFINSTPFPFFLAAFSYPASISLISKDMYLSVPYPSLVARDYRTEWSLYFLFWSASDILWARLILVRNVIGCFIEFFRYWLWKNFASAYFLSVMSYKDIYSMPFCYF